WVPRRNRRYIEPCCPQGGFGGFCERRVVRPGTDDDHHARFRWGGGGDLRGDLFCSGHGARLLRLKRGPGVVNAEHQQEDRHPVVREKSFTHRLPRSLESLIS